MSNCRIQDTAYRPPNEYAESCGVHHRNTTNLSTGGKERSKRTCAKATLPYLSLEKRMDLPNGRAEMRPHFLLRTAGGFAKTQSRRRDRTARCNTVRLQKK